ncbi:MAG: tellurite resistance TerB family protein [Synechococcaceae cyanobacterium]|nr:tellurite resistance TerB family protein [Synechococcaceae cyanobacterium]
MTPAEAFAVIPLAAVYSDGDFDRKEAQVVQDHLRPRWPYREMRPLAMGELVDGLLQRLRADRWEDLIHQAGGVLTREQQESAFAIAAELVFCNRSVTPEEQRFLTLLADALALPSDRARNIIEVFYLLHLDALRPNPSPRTT